MRWASQVQGFPHTASHLGPAVFMFLGGVVSVDTFTEKGNMACMAMNLYVVAFYGQCFG